MIHLFIDDFPEVHVNRLIDNGQMRHREYLGLLQANILFAGVLEYFWHTEKAVNAQRFPVPSNRHASVPHTAN
ncbi:hypothetical protein [Sodalis sp.]|uniref:hypothetical protein n=1 Tax=Sodalis sp. (in: enterobacteria) TaxID=1898979 RepID=UPI003873903D